MSTSLKYGLVWLWFVLCGVSFRSSQSFGIATLKLFDFPSFVDEGGLILMFSDQEFFGKAEAARF